MQWRKREMSILVRGKPSSHKNSRYDNDNNQSITPSWWRGSPLTLCSCALIISTWPLALCAFIFCLASLFFSMLPSPAALLLIAPPLLFCPLSSDQFGPLWATRVQKWFPKKPSKFYVQINMRVKNMRVNKYLKASDCSIKETCWRSIFFSDY